MKIDAGLTISDVTSVIEAAKQVIADVIAEGAWSTRSCSMHFPA
jgi:hypothetical protein